MLDLLDLIGRDTALKRVASTDGGEYAGPCPFCPGGGADRLRVWPTTGRYWCRRCGRKGDAIEYLRERDGLSFAEAKARAGGSTQPPAGPACPKRPAARPARPAGPPPAAWQKRGRAVQAAAVAALWAPSGALAVAWLQARGLTAATIRAAGLGYIPHPGFESLALWGLPPATNSKGNPSKVFIPRGIVIPCEVGGALWYLKIRRLPGDRFDCLSCRRELTQPGLCQHCQCDNPKYLQIKGGRPALYGADTLRGKAAAVLCEGELDALLLGQAAGDLAGVATLGSASNRADVADFAEYLLPVGRYLLAYDLDGAGAKGAAALEGLTQRARRVSVPALPGVKDLTDFHKAGGNLRAWLTFELARHGAAPATMSMDMPTPPARQAAAAGEPCPICGQSSCSRPLCTAARAGKSWPLADLPEICAQLGIKIIGADRSQPGPLTLLYPAANVPAQAAPPESISADILGQPEPPPAPDPDYWQSLAEQASAWPADEVPA